MIARGETYDTVIVGAGSAGCLLANRLAADRKRRVLLLEAGEDDRWIWYHIPVGYMFSNMNPRSDWCYRTVEEPRLGGRAIPYPRGKAIGGSSAINAMIYMRGQAADFDHWRQLGLDGWAWRDVLPFFKAHEDYFGGVSEAHGGGGELRVDPPRVAWPVLDLVRRACLEAGIPASEDFNTGDNEGVGPLHVNQKHGRRFQSARAFLDPVRHRPNLSIETKTLVEKIVVADGRAVAVTYRRDGVAFQAQAREIILAAGAIGTPQLMMLSGIGPAEHLRSHGIDVVHDRPGVGANLHDHLQIPMRYRMSGTSSLNERFHSPISMLGMALQYALTRRGPLTMAPAQIGAFTRSSPAAATADIGYNIVPYTRSHTSIAELDREPGVTLTAYDCRPTSRGDVRLASPDPSSAPLIRPNYLATERDRDVAAAIVKTTERIMAQPALRPHHPRRFSPDPLDLTSRAAILEAVARVGNTIFHPVGSARMGRASDPLAVVDSNLRVIGIDGLRVVDASVMPAITSGNTNAPTMMIAEKAAAMIGAGQFSGELGDGVAACCARDLRAPK